MFVLHAPLQIKPGQAEAVEKEFLGPFRAAISAQEGFKGVQLLRPEDGGDYVLAIAFENQALQQKWVATDLHQQVWPLIDQHLVGFSVHNFIAV